MNDVQSSLPINTSVLPDGIFKLIDEKFFSVIQSLVGDEIVDIFRIQLMNSAMKLLNTSDVFLFFRIPSEETDYIKMKSCFKSSSGEYVVKPGIRSGVSWLVQLLTKKLKEEQDLLVNEPMDCQEKSMTDDFVENHPLLHSLVKWYQ